MIEHEVYSKENRAETNPFYLCIERHVEARMSSRPTVAA